MTNQQSQGKDKEIILTRCSSKEDGSCKICHETVSENDKGISCDVCQFWHHTKCIKMKDVSYKMYKKENLQWVCQECISTQREMNGLREIMLELMRNFEKEKEKDREERAMNLEEKEKDREEIAMIVMMMKKMSNQMTGLERMVEEKINEKIKESKRDIMATINEEMEEKFENFRRRKNLIVYGIPEIENEDENKKNETDHAHIKNLLNELKTNVKNYETSRIGRKIMDGKVRPIRIELNRESDKFEVLKKLENLRHTKNRTLKKAIITTDMSFKQREANKLLKEELKERRQAGEMNIKIRKGKIVKEGGGGSRPKEQI